MEIVKTEKRYFTYKRYEKGAIYLGNGIMTQGELNFWAIEARGYKTLRSAKKSTEKEILYNEYGAKEICTVCFTLEYWADKSGVSREFAYHAEKL